MLPDPKIDLLILLGSIAFLLVAGFLLLFVIYFVRKKQQMALEKQLSDQQRDQMMLEAQIEIQEQTLRHIGQELHDNFGQLLSLIKINLNMIDYVDQHAAAEKVREAKELTQQLITDIRSLSLSFSHNLIATQGLLQAIEWEIARIRKTNIFSVQFRADENIPHIATEKAIVLYRMVQEALNNALKHSLASELSVSILRLPDHIHITIADNGIGFNPAVHQYSGQGMSNLRTRAALTGATLDITSIPGEGTTLSVTFPV
ncbi:sensor histidine kinase [Rurimicrobium arvi]|uniref:histidine kinase n=1 Tax=Rurimicrobium arvi TaxID=2049916 RepID=A0ABP8MS50_9BACT